MKWTLIFVFVLFSLNALGRPQPTLHAFLFCKTFDKSIGKSVQLNYGNMKEELQLISNALNYSYKEYALTTRLDFTPRKIDEVLNSAKIDEEDIVILFFSTHGARSKRDTIMFPQVSVPPDLISAYRKHVQLSKRNPLFTLTLIEACNSSEKIDPQQRFILFQNQPEIDEFLQLSEKQVQNLKKLFLNSCDIIAAASEPGRASLAVRGSGSVFTDAFLGALNESLSYDDASWSGILERTRNATSQRSKVLRYTHNPVWQMKDCEEALHQSLIDSTVFIQKVKIEIACNKLRVRRNRFSLNVKIVGETDLLNSIESVTYYLHNTMENPIINRQNKNEGFLLRMAVWGEFPIRADLNFKDGTHLELIENMDFTSCIR